MKFLLLFTQRRWVLCFTFLFFIINGNFTKVFGENSTNISPITIVLRESVTATSDTLRLQDIVTTSVDASSIKNDNLIETSLGMSPLLGKEILFRRGDIDIILRRNHRYATWNWDGAQTCIVSRPATLISESQITELIEAALSTYSNKDGYTRVLKLLNYSPLLIPKEGSNIEVELISPNINSSYGSASINIDYRERSFTRRSIRFEWEWKRPVWVARDHQDSGRLVADGFVIENRNVLEINGEPLPGDPLPTNVNLIRPLSKGQPLLRTNLKTPIAVTSGSAITAQIHTGALLVSIKAIALENGSIGQTIHLKNSASHRDIVGKVIQENMVEVIP